MKSLKSMFLVFSLAALTILFFVQCDKDPVVEPEPSTAKGTASFEITDAPIDDAEIRSVFVTIAAVKVDGETFNGFSGKQTIDLLAYQEGDVKALGLGELEAGTYTNVTLVLDYETDAQGNTPGCFVETTDDMKHDLEAQGNANQELVISKTFMIRENTQSNIVLDFDVRKAVRANSTGSSNYTFVTHSELEATIRAVDKDDTGIVKGQCNDNSMAGSDKIVVYAYKKGTWNQSVETQGQGESQIMFKNAITSTVADANGNYTLAFLEEGEYELYLAGYEDNDNGGKFEFQGLFELGGLIGLNSNVVNVEAGVQLSFDISLTALIP